VFHFITKRPLWVNVLASLGLLLLLLLIFLGSLQLITRHGKNMKIPSVLGQTLSDAKKTLESQGFEVQLQDSVYFDTIPPLQVIKQVPEADNLVKVNRVVFLVINRAVAPFVAMPNLVSMSFRNAEMVLSRYGLKLKDTVFKPDFAKNSVLDQLYQDQTIKPGTRIQQGSAISLVLGNGIGGYEFAVPDLFGLTYQEARLAMEADGLILGAVVPDNDVRDTAGAYIYRQSPGQFDDEKRLNRIRQGQTIDIFLSSQKPVRKEDSLGNPSSPNN
jgi:eukaryotic-like serine/threonine-protein kinase